LSLGGPFASGLPGHSNVFFSLHGFPYMFTPPIFNTDPILVIGRTPLAAISSVIITQFLRNPVLEDPEPLLHCQDCQEHAYTLVLLRSKWKRNNSLQETQWSETN
jgi:hypothetical protein